MIENYYKLLNDYLSQFGLHLGKNLTNPDLGVVNPDEVGIYDGELQIGKLKRSIKGDNLLVLDHIKSYRRTNKKKYGIVDKVYPFDVEFAKNNHLHVHTNAVEDYTYNKFLEYYKDWDIKQWGRKLWARNPFSECFQKVYNRLLKVYGK